MIERERVRQLRECQRKTERGNKDGGGEKKIRLEK